MSIATELTEAGTPRVLYLSRSDVVAVGGDHSAHGKAGVEDIACAAEVYTRAKQQIGTWLDLY